MDVDHKKNLLRRKIYRQPPPLDFLPDGRNRLNRSHQGDLIRKFVLIDEAVEIGAKKPTRRPFEGACNRRDPKRQKIFGKWKNVAGGKARPKSAYSAGKKCQMPSRCAALRHLITSAQRNFLEFPQTKNCRTRLAAELMVNFRPKKVGTQLHGR